jgi:hypothetical protein
LAFSRLLIVVVVVARGGNGVVHPRISVLFTFKHGTQRLLHVEATGPAERHHSGECVLASSRRKATHNQQKKIHPRQSSADAAFPMPHSAASPAKPTARDQICTPRGIVFFFLRISKYRHGILLTQKKTTQEDTEGLSHLS